MYDLVYLIDLYIRTHTLTHVGVAYPYPCCITCHLTLVVAWVWAGWVVV